MKRGYKISYINLRTLNIFLEFIVIFIISVLLTTKNSLAQAQFETQYDINYTIDKDGQTIVSQTTNIVNKVDDVIPTSYILKIKQLHIYDIEVTSKKQKLDTEITTENEETVIKVKFDNYIIGKERKSTINITYKTKDIATKIGNVWNITIPKVSIPETTTGYAAEIKIPKELGPKIFISPTPLEEKADNETVSYVFNKEKLNNIGITAAFGKYQTINFKLNYNVKNTSLFPKYKEIALPPQINQRQQIVLDSINPKPSKLNLDQQGNLLAKYFLLPQQEKDIEVVGSARILGKQIDPETGGKLGDLPKDLVLEYTKEQKYWETNSAEVRDLAKTLYSDKKTVAQNASAIYDYITKNLKYNFEITKNDFVDRKGALAALKNKELAACMEFTDVFIAVARAMGIPARELDGYAFSGESGVTPISINLKSGDLLHAWPEFYDPNLGWVAIDPTWGTTSQTDYFTKLDTNHFVFVIKGLNSETPLPAGLYKTNENEKQVEVDFSQNQTQDDEKFVEKISTKKLLTFNLKKWFSGQQKYLLKNETGLMILNINDIGISLLPFENKEVYFPKDTSKILVTDLSGNKRDVELTTK